MPRALSFRKDVTFDLDDGWVELPSQPDALADDSWQRWRATLDIDTEGTSFDWMEGLVPPETKELSEAYAKKVVAEEKKKRKKSTEQVDPASVHPLNEVADYLRSGQKIAPLKVLGRPDDATLLFVFVPTKRSPDALRPLVDRVVRWTGVKVDGGGGDRADISLVGDSYGTMDWGLHSVEIRAYASAGIVVFGVAASNAALEAGFGRLRLPKPTNDKEVDPRKLQPDGRRGKPKKRMRALLELLGRTKLSMDLLFPIKGTLNDSLNVGVIFEPQEQWKANGHAFADVEGFTGYLEKLAKAGMNVDPTGARLVIFEVPGKSDHLAFHTAWTSALCEILEKDAAEIPAGSIACTTDWGSSFAPPTMQMTKVVRHVPIGAVVLDKVRYGRSIETEYYVATKTGVERLADKDVAAQKLTDIFITSARTTGRMPFHSTVGRSFKNGNVEVTFEPTRYDRFVLRITEALAGEAPSELLARLSEAAPIVKAKAPLVPDEKWISEPAKSNRSTCKSCGKTIEMGTLRRGEPHDYQGSISYRWHHDACVRPKA
jgi:hypothetical protein